MSNDHRSGRRLQPEHRCSLVGIFSPNFEVRAPKPQTLTTFDPPFFLPSPITFQRTWPGGCSLPGLETRCCLDPLPTYPRLGSPPLQQPPGSGHRQPCLSVRLRVFLDMATPHSPGGGSRTGSGRGTNGLAGAACGGGGAARATGCRTGGGRRPSSFQRDINEKMTAPK